MDEQQHEQQQEPITVLVLGAGGFGKHYVTNLAKLNSDNTLNIPKIGKIVFTKTDYDRKNLAEKSFREQLQSETCPDIVGECVESYRDLGHICDRHKPKMIFITAKDSGSFGNRIHVDYTNVGLQYCSVMCEKPFTDASGDGMSISVAEDLRALATREHVFSLELPLAQVRKELEASTYFADKFREAGTIKIFYGTLNANPDMTVNKVVNDLAIHPWSMIPEEYSFQWVEASQTENLITISSTLTDNSSPSKSCDIQILPGRNCRIMSIDNLVLGFRQKGAITDVVEMRVPYEKAVFVDNNYINGRVILTVENPLRKNIVSALQGVPLTGAGRIVESQTFLENIFGYR